MYSEWGKKKELSGEKKKLLFLKTWKFLNWKTQYLKFKTDSIKSSVDTKVSKRVKLSKIKNDFSTMNRAAENCKTVSKCLV